MDAVLAGLAQGFTVARKEDATDGEALRRLREALPEGWKFSELTRDFFNAGWRVALMGPVTGERCSHGQNHERPRHASGTGPTIAAAADAAREAIEAGR